MANPVFEGSQGGYSNIATTSHSASLDATASAGDLLLIFAASATNAVSITVSGATLIDGGTIDDGGPTGEYAIFWKVATGGESSVSISTGSSVTLSYAVLRFSNAEYATKSTAAFDTSTAPNSGTPTSPTTGDSFYQVAFSGWHGGTYQTGYPTNYTVGQTESNDSFDAGSVSEGVVAACRLVASVEDPAAFTLDDSVGWVAQTFTVISDDGGTTHNLTGAGITAATSVANGGLSQDHQLDGNNVTAASAVASTGGLSQDHQFAGSDITSATHVASTGSITQDHQLALGGITAGSTVAHSGVISQDHQIDPSDITAATSVASSGGLTQDHQLDGSDITSATSVASTGSLSPTDLLEGSDVTAGTTVSSAGVLSQDHQLDGSDLTVATTVSSNAMVGEDSLLEASSISSASTVAATSTLTQDHQLDGSDIVSGTTIGSGGGQGNLSQLHSLGGGTGLSSGSSVSSSGGIQIGSAGPRRCCCTEGGCDVQDDDFNRADSDSLGSKWIEVSGDGDIVNNMLVVYSGITLTTARQIPPILPGHDYAHRYLVTLKRSDGTNSYTSWRLICNWQDSSNYSYIDVSYDSGSGEWTPAFYNVSGGGSPALVMDITTHPQSPKFSSDPDGDLDVQVCYAEAEWTFGDLKSENQWTNCEANPAATLPANPSHGLVGFGPGAYDDFNYDVHWESRRECNNCQCFCRLSETDFSCIPETLTMTLVPVGGAYSGGYGPCPTPSNLVFTLYQVSPILGATEPDAPTLTPNRETASKRVWHSGLITGDTGSANINGRYHRIMLVCNDVDGLYLTVQQNPNNDPFNNGTASDNTNLGFNPSDRGGASGNRTFKYLNAARSSCDPLNLVFEDLFVNLGVTCNPYSDEYEVFITP